MAASKARKRLTGVPGYAPLRLSEPLIEFVDGQRFPVAEAFAAMRPENMVPIRESHVHRGMKNMTGKLWSSTTNAHVQFESIAESDTLRCLDFDPAVLWIVAQPYILWWQSPDGPRSHIPDYLAFGADHRLLTADVRPTVRVDDDFRRQSDATRDAITAAGQTYRHIAEIDPILLKNIRRLHYFAPPLPRRLVDVVDAIAEMCTTPQRTDDVVESCGNVRSGRRALMHMLWEHDLTCTLTAPLREHTMNRVPSSPPEVSW